MKTSTHMTLATGLLALAGAAHALSNADLAFHYAPVHYQDTDNSDYPSEYLTASTTTVTGSPPTTGQPRQRPVAASVYYSVVESCTHYFITYGFYHPRDWSDTAFDQEHENDMEGTIMAVRKNGTTYGALEGMITVFHTNFFSFTPAGSPFTSGGESIDGSVSFQAHNGVNRPKTAQEAKGHGLKAWPYIGNFTGTSSQTASSISRRKVPRKCLPQAMTAAWPTRSSTSMRPTGFSVWP